MSRSHVPHSLPAPGLPAEELRWVASGLRRPPGSTPPHPPATYRPKTVQGRVEASVAEATFSYTWRDRGCFDECLVTQIEPTTSSLRSQGSRPRRRHGWGPRHAVSCQSEAVPKKRTFFSWLIEGSLESWVLPGGGTTRSTHDSHRRPPRSEPPKAHEGKERQKE